MVRWMRAVALAASLAAAAVLPAQAAAETSASPQAQQVYDQLGEWMAPHLAHQVGQQQLVVVDAGELAQLVEPSTGRRGQPVAATDTRTTWALPSVAAGLDRLAAHRCTAAAAWALYLALHERAHRVAPATPEKAGVEWMEEGFTDAVAFDLLPAAWHRFCPGRPAYVWQLNVRPGYVAWERDARAASAWATGKPWGSRAARLERRRVLAMTWPERRAWLTAAQANRP